ncbi:hypothetical protein VWT76_23655, partial [Xanthomonas citri pv. citri]
LAMDVQPRAPEYGARRHHACHEVGDGRLAPLLATARSGGITIETSKKYVFQHLFARVVYNDEGVPVERGDAFDANDPTNLEQH